MKLKLAQGIGGILLRGKDVIGKWDHGNQTRAPQGGLKKMPHFSFRRLPLLYLFCFFPVLTGQLFN